MPLFPKQTSQRGYFYAARDRGWILWIVDLSYGIHVLVACVGQGSDLSTGPLPNERMATLEGFEPTTYCLEGSRSIH